MKKVVLLLITTISFFSCSNNIEFNTPAFQAKKDGEIWKASTFRANVDIDGKLTITGAIDNIDNLTLRVSSTMLTTHLLGNTEPLATYNDGSGKLFSTNNSPDPDFSLFEPDGKIEIYEFDSVNKVVSGRFNFNAYDISGNNLVNFNEGDFYRVPITGEVIANACDGAIQLVTTTEALFSSTPSSDTNYSIVCNDYKNALTNQINECGDTGGSLQMLLDGLGDCSTLTACDAAIASVTTAQANYDVVTNMDSSYPTVCNDYKSALMDQIDQCGDSAGTLQTIIDGLGTCTVATSGPSGVISVNVGTAPVTFETNITITQSGTFLTVTAEDNLTGSTISFVVQEGLTGTDIISNFMIEIGATNYVPTTNPMEVFTSNIAVNDMTNLMGTFSGTVESTTTGPDFMLSNGIIEIMY